MKKLCASGFRTILPALAIVTLIWAGSPAHAAKFTPEKPSIKLGLPVAAVTFLPIYVAKEQKYFEEEGLNVDLLIFRGGTAMVKALIGGSVDVGLTAFAGVSVGIKAGQPLKVFYGGYNMPVFEWWAIPRIKSVKDSKGARYGVSTIGSSTDFLTRYALTSNGIDPKTEVKIIQGGASGARLAAMDAGQLDVNIFSSPQKFMSAEKGYNRILRQKDLADDYPFHTFFTLESYIAANPNTLKAFLRAQIRGIRKAKSDPAAAKAALEKWVKVNPKYTKRTIDDFIDDIYEDGRMPSARGMKVFFDQGIMSGAYKEQWPESRYLHRELIDSYQSWKP